MADYTYHDPDGQYYDAAGVAVAVARLAQHLAALEAAVVAALHALTLDHLDGELPVAAWEAAMLRAVNAGLLAATALAVGGWARTDRAVQLDVARLTAAQAPFLAAFARDLQRAQLSEAQILARAALYGGSVHAAYQERRSRDARQYGYQEVRNVLTGGAHCAACAAEGARGWVALGMLSLPGTRTCRSNCRCYLEYRRVPAVVSP